MKEIQLFVYQKAGDPFSFDFTEDKVSMGRSSDNDISIPDPFCSGFHARIDRLGKDFILKDNDSKNGPILNGGETKS